jgi:hypothetical protein
MYDRLVLTTDSVIRETPRRLSRATHDVLPIFKRFEEGAAQSRQPDHVRLLSFLATTQLCGMNHDAIVLGLI